MRIYGRHTKNTEADQVSHCWCIGTSKIEAKERQVAYMQYLNAWVRECQIQKPGKIYDVPMYGHKSRIMVRGIMVRWRT